MDRGTDRNREEPMSKKLFCFALCAMLLALSLPAEAQQAGKVYRIGYVCGCSRPLQPHHIAFWQRLRELGYVEGQNVVIEERKVKHTGSRAAQAAKVAAEMVQLKLDVIVTMPGVVVTSEFVRIASLHR